jgi:EmrB/QacA subfamily drug resistance transporter
MHHDLTLRGKLIIMLSVMASLFLVALDQTIIATALGKIVEEFDAFESLSWIVTAYLLTTTVTVPIAGKLSDLFGRRKLLLIGVAIFTIGSLFSGIAGDINMLIWARAVQGIGGGIITANAFTIVGDLFAARERGKWQGLIGATFGLSSVVGPLLGGWLTEGQTIGFLTTDWRWNFFINVPIAIVAFILIWVYCPKLKHVGKPIIDYKGATLISVALALTVLAVDNTEMIFSNFLETTGMSLMALRITMVAIIVLAVGLFIKVEKNAKHPILNIDFFKNKNFTLISFIAMLFGAGFMGAILYLTQFNQQVFGASPTVSGLMLIPMVVGIMIASVGAGQIISRTGHYKIFMQFGIILATIMVGLLIPLNPNTPFIYEAVIMVFLGLGLGCVMPVLSIAVQNEFGQKDLGAATSSTQLFRGLGSTVGIAVFGALLTSGLTANLASIENNNYVKQLSQSSAVSKFGDLSDVNTLINLNIPDTKQKISDGFTKSIAHLPETQRQPLQKQFTVMQDEFGNKIEQAFSKALNKIFIASAIMMLVASVAVFMLTERELKKASPNTTPSAV